MFSNDSANRRGIPAACHQPAQKCADGVITGAINAHHPQLSCLTWAFFVCLKKGKESTKVHFTHQPGESTNSRALKCGPVSIHPKRSLFSKLSIYFKVVILQKHIKSSNTIHLAFLHVSTVFWIVSRSNLIFVSNLPGNWWLFAYNIAISKKKRHLQMSRILHRKLRQKKSTKQFVRLSGSYSLEVHPNGQPVTLPTLTGLRDAHAQTAF